MQVCLFQDVNTMTTHNIVGVAHPFNAQLSNKSSSINDFINLHTLYVQIRYYTKVILDAMTI